LEDSTNKEVKTLYENLIEAWNNRNATGMAELFTYDGELIGFDGSQVVGKDEIFLHLEPIFANHPTPPFIRKVKDIKGLGAEHALLRAIVGMIPNGKTEINPDLNAHQTLIASKREGKWKIELFQNTPAQFQGRPELVEKMTDELRQLLRG
jgi:uncharacterized protein (TIGR02246 family)